MVQCTNTGRRPKEANEISFVLVYQHGGDDVTLKPSYTLLETECSHHCHNSSSFFFPSDLSLIKFEGKRMRTQYLYFEHLLTITTFFGAVLLAILGTFRFFANLPEIYTNRIVIFFFFAKTLQLYQKSDNIINNPSNPKKLEILRDCNCQIAITSGSDFRTMYTPCSYNA